jgi:hypothetical protein
MSGTLDQATSMGDQNGATVTSDVSSSSDSDRVFIASLNASNNSGVSGAALFTLHDNVLTIDIAAKGLEPGEVHPQHIHGFENGQPSSLPTLAQDLDHDGFIEDTEAEQAAGPVILSLTASGTPTSNEHTNDFPVAGADGTLKFHQTYTFDTSVPEQATELAQLQHLELRAFEMHGESVPQGEGAGTPNEVDGTGGYKQDLPVGGGLIHEITGTPLADATTVLGHDASGDLLQAIANLDPDHGGFLLGHG